jgi:hypothetical protein
MFPLQPNNNNKDRKTLHNIHIIKIFPVMIAVSLQLNNSSKDHKILHNTHLIKNSPVTMKMLILMLMKMMSIKKKNVVNLLKMVLKI